MDGSPQPVEKRNSEEGVRLAEAAKKAGCPLKLFGGVAVWYLCPSAHRQPLVREYADIDFATLSARTRDARRFFASQRYEADRLFNALHGASRMRFSEQVTGNTIDVIVDRFVECHTIDLRRSLSSDGLTIALTELLLTKLQIVHINEKDLRDILAMLLDHPVTAGQTDAIDPDHIARLTSGDWGLEHTIRLTLERVPGAALKVGLGDEAAAIVRARVADLLRVLDAAPKSIGWRVRGRIGERMRWYETPEEPRR
jgi:hypothetical protein